MITKELIKRSPIRVLEQSIHGGLEAGQLGALVARSGAGKTACVVQFGLDALLRGRTVLHISNEAPVGHLRSYYDELFQTLAREACLENATQVLLEVERRRLLISQQMPSLRLDAINAAAAMASGALGGEPDVLIIEGFDFETASETHINALKDLAWGLGASLWMTVRSHRHEPVTHPNGFPPPIDKFDSLVDVLLQLESQAGRTVLHVMKDHGNAIENSEPLALDPVTMQLIEAGAGIRDMHTPESRARFLLHSGGAQGAESAFGEAAERHGIREIVFSFEGHASRVRNRGLRMLTEEELRLGDVSLRYLSHHLGRTFPSTPQLRRIIQSIWHQVRPCEQVFVVGEVQDDGTVRGGTGWGAELARRWRKDLHVFDQNKGAWLHWNGVEWEQVTPLISSPMFAGIGTAHLSPAGRAAIDALFDRSFPAT